MSVDSFHCEAMPSSQQRKGSRSGTATPAVSCPQQSSHGSFSFFPPSWTRQYFHINALYTLGMKRRTGEHRLISQQKIWNPLLLFLVLNEPVFQLNGRQPTITFSTLTLPSPVAGPPPDVATLYTESADPRLWRWQTIRLYSVWQR